MTYVHVSLLILLRSSGSVSLTVGTSSVSLVVQKHLSLASPGVYKGNEEEHKEQHLCL